MKRNTTIIIIISLVAGLFIGWLLFRVPGERKPAPVERGQVPADSVKKTIWTCSMHPQIRMDHPGECPICGMELIPLVPGSSDSDSGYIHLSPSAAKLANVTTSIVTKQKPVKEIRLYGKVQVDERLFQSQVAHFPGRIEKLMVNFTGEQVRKGQVLAEIYSSDLVTAQQELLETAKTKQSQPELYEASREKLRQWMLTDHQIESIEKSGTVRNDFEVLSNTSGTVILKNVNTGDHVLPGTELFKIADLSNVWIQFDAYESDLQFLKKGDKVTFTIQALPGMVNYGTIVFIDPVIDPVTRVARVRVETENPNGQFKPEMFATGIVSSMPAESGSSLVIPHSAVLWTGKRSIVYVKEKSSEEPVFRLREVELGPDLGNSYVITGGLEEGEEIVTSGTFNVDAAAQLEGKPSMMNPN